MWSCQANNLEFQTGDKVDQVSKCVGRTSGDDLDHYIQDIQAEKKELFITFHFWVVDCLMGDFNYGWRGLDPRTTVLANEAFRRTVPHL